MLSSHRSNWLHSTNHVLFVLIIVAFAAVYICSPTRAVAQPGHTVVVDGDIAVVGTPWQDGYTGAAHILRRSGDNWDIEQTLAVGSDYGQFGKSVAVNGDIIAIGAPWHDLMRVSALIV